MVESFERVPPLTVAQLKRYMEEITPDLNETTSKIVAQIRLEVQSMYQLSLLERSLYWHAFALSAIKGNWEPLPTKIENGVGAVIIDLIERRLKPTLLQS